LAVGGAPRFCDATAFFDLALAGAQYLKYGTRHDPTPLKIRKVKALRKMSDLASTLSSTLPLDKARRIFIQKMSGWDGTRF